MLKQHRTLAPMRTPQTLEVTMMVVMEVMMMEVTMMMVVVATGRGVACLLSNDGKKQEGVKDKRR